MAHDYDRILTRLTIILNRLYEGDELSVTDLAEEFNVSNKTIQRDFNERLCRFPIEKRGRRWRMIEGYKLEKKRSSDEALILDILENISDGIGALFSQKSRAMLSKIKNANQNPVYAKVAIEDISEKLDELSLLEEAITQSRCIQIYYKKKERTIQPYRIVNFEGYWYLLGVDSGDGRAKTFYLKDIYRIRLMEEIFQKDTNLDEKMRGAVNAWFEPDKEPFEVTLLAHAEIARYFQRRPISSTQQITQCHGDGSLEITLKITSYQEILPTIKYWMPHLQVLEPRALQSLALEAAESFISESRNLESKES